MNTNKGYIYVRRHESYDIYNACKLGKTKNIPEREGVYITGELKKGYFELVFEVQLEEMTKIELLLQNEFHKYHIKYNGGTEFYSNKIIELIEPYLKNNEIKHNRLTNQEISNLIRTYRIKNLTQKINTKELIRKLKTNIQKKMYEWHEREYQTYILNCQQEEEKVILFIIYLLICKANLF